VASKKATGRTKSRTKKLNLKKETLKDLDSRGKAVKGGTYRMTVLRACVARPGGTAGPTICMPQTGIIC
jgi:hypothetical protein